MLVSEIMSTPVVTATADEPVATAATRMREQGVGSVVVVDGTRATGILTERDLVRLAASGNDPSARLLTAVGVIVVREVNGAALLAELRKDAAKNYPVADETVGGRQGFRQTQSSSTTHLFASPCSTVR